MNHSFRRGFPILLTSLSALLLLSCGKNDEIPETVPVAGKVTVDGEPLTGGHVTYHAYDTGQKTGAECSGKIDSTGGYVMFTGPKQGVPPGRYKVTVSRSTMPTAEGKMPTAGFNLKFSDPTKTPLVITVSDGAAPGTYDLKLTKK